MKTAPKNACRAKMVSTTGTPGAIRQRLLPPPARTEPACLLTRREARAECTRVIPRRCACTMTTSQELQRIRRVKPVKCASLRDSTAPNTSSEAERGAFAMNTGRWRSAKPPRQTASKGVRVLNDLSLKHCDTKIERAIPHTCDETLCSTNTCSAIDVTTALQGWPWSYS